MRNKKVTALVLVSVITVMAFLCSHPSHIGSLEYVDSLLVHQKYQLALDSLQAMDTTSFKTKESAYYSLLLTQARYRSNMVATSDTAINVAVNYYSKSNDEEKYTRSLIYQGCVNEQLGYPEKAVISYHKAEEVAKGSELTNLLAFAKLRLGSLYQSHVVGAKTIAATKFHEALNLYKQLGDKHFTILCLGEIGGLYRERKDKADSALYYINEAIEMSKSTPGEQYALFSNYTSRAQYYAYAVHDYQKAKDDAITAIATIDSGLIDHPRAHFAAAFAYIHLGKTDSCNYYLREAPAMTCNADSLLYYRVLTELCYQHGEYPKAFDYYKKSMRLGDSALVSSLTHRLLAIEKRYDMQQASLQNEKLQSRLKNALLALAVIVAIGFGLLSIALEYKSKLRNKENEYKLVKADLDSSITSLRRAQTTLDSYEGDMAQATSTITRLNQEIDDAHHHLSDMEAEKALIEQEMNRASEQLTKLDHLYQKNLVDSQENITQLKEQISKVKDELDSKERERAVINERLTELEKKKSQSDEIKTIMDDQIKVLRQLMQWAYEYDGATFARKFNSLMTIQSDKQTESYWNNLQSLVNDLYDNILDKAQEQAGGILRDDELNFIALYCCGFSRTAIMVCLRYKHIVTISNKKVQIARKLNVPNLDEFVIPYQEKKTSSIS